MECAAAALEVRLNINMRERVRSAGVRVEGGGGGGAGIRGVSEMRRQGHEAMRQLKKKTNKKA